MVVSTGHKEFRHDQHTVRKNAMETLEVVFSMAVPLKDRRMAISIIEIPMPSAPNTR
jgi:hypothetical protein